MHRVHSIMALSCCKSCYVILQVLEAMVVRIQDECGSLLQRTMAPQSGLQGFDFLGNSILTAVDEQLASSMPGQLSICLLSYG